MYNITLVAQLFNLVVALIHGYPINADQANATMLAAQQEIQNGCVQFCDMPIKLAGEITVPTTTVEVATVREFIDIQSLPPMTGYEGSIGK